jgi:hypothetical protein
LNRLAQSSLVQGDGSVFQVATPGAANEKLELGKALYQQFNRFPADQIEHVHHNRQIPPVVVGLGELRGIIYQSDKWQPGRPRTYIHFLEDKPRLVSNVEGTQLYLVGGNYRITSHGIEG